MDKWIEILKAGEYPQGNVTIDDLQLIVNYYDPSLQMAPFIPEHRKFDANGELINNMSALGWIKSVRLNGNSLEVLPEDIETLSYLYDGKSYKYASAEIQTEEIEGKRVPYLAAVALTNFPASKIKAIKLTSNRTLACYSTKLNFTKENKMDLKKLCALLGIAENSTEEQANAELKKLTEKAGASDKLAEILKLVKAPEKKDGDDNSDIAKLTATVTKLTETITSLTSKTELQEETEAVAAFNQAVTDKKFLPSQQEILVGTKEKPGTYYKNANGLRAFAATMPVISVTPEVQVPKNSDGKTMTYADLLNDPKKYQDVEKNNPQLFTQLRDEFLANPGKKQEEKK